MIAMKYMTALIMYRPNYRNYVWNYHNFA